MVDNNDIKFLKKIYKYYDPNNNSKYGVHFKYGTKKH